MSDIVIRPYQPSDKAVALSLIGEMQSHERPLQACVLPWENFRDAFWKWLTSNMEQKAGFMLLAEDKTGVVGLVAGWMGKEDFPGIKADEQRFGYISDVVVSASARKRGTGSALMHAAENVFLRQGVTSMRLMAFANNELADNFYLAYGMQRYVTTYKKYLVGAR